jgi:hypothetical protein
MRDSVSKTGDRRTRYDSTGQSGLAFHLVSFFVFVTTHGRSCCNLLVDGSSVFFSVRG